MSVIGSTRSNCGAAGSSKTRICFSWPKKVFSSKAGVLLLWRAYQSTYRVYWRRMVRDCKNRRKTRLNLNEGCILAVLALFNKMTANHDIISLRTTDFAMLSSFLIQLDKTTGFWTLNRVAKQAQTLSHIC